MKSGLIIDCFAGGGGNRTGEDRAGKGSDITL